MLTAASTIDDAKVEESPTMLDPVVIKQEVEFLMKSLLPPSFFKEKAQKS